MDSASHERSWTTPWPLTRSGSSGSGPCARTFPPRRSPRRSSGTSSEAGCTASESSPRPPGQAARLAPVIEAAHEHGGLPVVVHGFAPTAEGLHTLAGLAVRYPGVPLIVSQLGGLNWMTAIELARDTPNMYLELSTANVIFAVKLAVQELPERTLFGSDAPYGDPVLARATVERVTPPGELRDLVLGGTLGRLLGIL